MARLLIALVPLLAACGTPFEVELPEQPPRLVVESLFAADSLIALDIGQSASVLEPGAPFVESVRDATVRIYEDGVLAGDAAYDALRDRYLTNVRARAGRTYRLEVEAPGFAPVEAEDTVPRPTPFEIEVVRGPEPETDRSREDAVTLRFADPPGDDFYAIYGLSELTFTGSDQRRVGPLSFTSTDPLLTDGDVASFLTDFDEPFYQRAVFRSLLFDGETAAVLVSVLRYEDASGASRATDRLRLATLSETYYSYVRALDGSSEGTPFSTPRALPSNVVGGYGIFAAFAAAERVLPD